jgi:hypothetical protein
MRITDRRHSTSLSEITPGHFMGDVGRGGLVQGIAGFDISSLTPTNGQILVYNASTNKWDPLTLLGWTGTTISPAQLVANTDNWNPTGLSTASIIRASTDASRNLTGIIAPAAGDRIFVVLENVGAQDLVLKHDATSTAANRFYCPDDADLTLQKDSAVLLVYDGTSLRWRVLGGSGSALTWAAISALIPAGTYELATAGGQDVIKAHGSLGATATFNPADGNVHTGTLNANCTVTLTAPSGSGACTLELWLTEDGTGGWTVIWPGSVTEQGTHVTTLSTTSRVILETLDGGTTWVATWVGGSAAAFATPAIVLGTAAAAGAATTAIRSDSAIAAFDSTNPTSSAPGDAAATGSLGPALAAYRAHKHAREALSTAIPLVESGAGSAGSSVLQSRDDHIHPAAASSGAAHYLVIASAHSTPLVFDDIVQSSAHDDFVYSS